MLKRDIVALALMTVLILSPTTTTLRGEGSRDGPDVMGLTATKLADNGGPFSVYNQRPSGTYYIQETNGITTSPTAWTVATGGTGWMLSTPFTIQEGDIWDYAVVTPASGNPPEASVTLTVLDPDGTPGGGFDGEVLGQVTASATGVVHLDLRDVDADAHIRLQLHILLDAALASVQAGLAEWRLGECDLDLWHDPFLDIGRDSSRGDLGLGGGSVFPVAEYLPGGIKGDYYDNRDFTAFRYTQLDPVIDFGWGNGGPTGLGTNTFSIRWTGKLNVARTERYTLYLRVDDGGRLWVDGQQLIDEWRDQGATEFSAQVDLGVGLHDLRVDYYENQGGATCELRYSTPTISKRIIPQTALWGKEAVNVLLSEPITCPAGQTWELLLLERGTGHREGSVVVDVLDASTGTSPTGLDGITADAVDLRGLSSSWYPSIQLRARWTDANITRPPKLEDWALKWVPVRTWRTEFLTDMGIIGKVGLLRGRGYITQFGMENHSQVAFAESFDGISHTLSSGVYNMFGGRVGGVVTTNASDVAMADLDGDDVLDIIYTFSTQGSAALSYGGYAGGVRDLPLYTFNHSQGAGDKAVFTTILVVDLDDNGVDEVVLAELTTSGKGRLLLYTRERLASGSPPTVLLGDVDGTISDARLGNFDGDGYRDIALAVSEGPEAGAIVVWGTSSGFSLSTSRRLLSRPCYALGVADFIDTTWTWDDLVVGCGKVGTPPAYDIINRSNIIFAGDDDRAQMGPWLAMDGAPAKRMEVITEPRRPETLVIVTVQNGTACEYHPPYRFGPNVTRPVDVSDIAPIPLGPGGGSGLVYAILEDPGLDPAGYPNVESFSSSTWYSEYPTDGAVAVAAGSMFGLGTGAFRTDKIDVGDPRFIGGWGNLSYEVLSGGPSTGQEVVLRVLDGETEALIWNRTSSESRGSFELTSVIKVKEHPTIILEVLLRNQNPSDRLSLGELRVDWVPRTAKPPDVLSIVADDPVIYRTNATTLRISVDDEYDLPKDLSLVVQVGLPGSSGWLPIGMGTMTWDGSAYVLSFDTTRDYPTGNYSFRARATDVDMMISEWFQVDGLVRVINNPPGAPKVSISPSSPGTADELRCVIDVQANDRDGSSMEYIYAWSRNGVPAPEHAGAVVPASATVKGDEWSVVVRAFDGEDMGPVVKSGVTVVNSAPVLVRPLEPIMIYEDDDSVIVDLSGHFADPDGDALSFEVTGLRDVLVELDASGKVARFILSPEWSGTETAIINVTDGELWYETRFGIDVRPVDDAPTVISIGGMPAVSGVFRLSARQDLLAEFEVVVVDPDSTSFKFSADVLPGWMSVGPLNGTISVLAPNDGVGVHTLNLSVRDGTGEMVYVAVELTVIDVNDPPGTVFINQPKNGKVFQATDAILLQGACTDPDERWGQTLTFTWYTNASAEPLGTGTTLTLPKLSVGDHTIKLEVSDGLYVKVADVRIRVLPPTVPPPPDGNGGDEPYVGPRTMGTMGPVLVAILLVLLVIIAAIALVVRQRAARGRLSSPVTGTGKVKDQDRAIDKDRAGNGVVELRGPRPEGGVETPLKGVSAGIRLEQPMPRTVPTEEQEARTGPVGEQEEQGPPAPMPDGWGFKKVPPPQQQESWEGWEEF